MLLLDLVAQDTRLYMLNSPFSIRPFNRPEVKEVVGPKTIDQKGFGSLAVRAKVTSRAL